MEPPQSTPSINVVIRLDSWNHYQCVFLLESLSPKGHRLIFKIFYIYMH